MGTKERKQRLENEVTGRQGFKLGFGLYFIHFPVSRFPLPVSRIPFLVLVPPIFWFINHYFRSNSRVLHALFSCTFYMSGVIGGGHV